jgi:WD40 repeat protein
MKRSFALFFTLFTFSAAPWAQDNVDLVTQEKNLGIITLIRYSPNGRHIASVSDKENTVKVWDVQTGKLIGTLKGHSGHINDIAFHPSGDFIYSVSKDKKLYTWELNNWAAQDSIVHDRPIKKVVSLDSDVLFICDSQNKCFLLKGGELSSVLHAGKKQITSLSGSNSLVAVASGKTVHVYQDGRVLSEKTILHGHEISHVIIEAGLLAVADVKGQVVVYNLEGRSEMLRIPAHNKPITAFDLNVEKNKLVTTSSDRTTVIWNLTDGSSISSLRYAQQETPEEVRAIEISPDGNTIASSAFSKSLINVSKTKDNSIKIWNATTGNLYKVLKGEVNPLQAFCFHHEENILYSVQNNKLSIWDLDYSERKTEFTLHKREIIKEEVASKIAKNLEKDKVINNFNKFKSFANKKLNLKDLGLNEKAKEKSIESGTAIIRKKTTKYDRIYVSQTGSYLITQFLDDEIRLYDLEKDDQKQIKQIETGQETMINDISLDPKERYIALAGSGDKAISILSLTTGNLVKLLATEKKEGKSSLNVDITEARALSFDTKGNRLSALFNTGLIMVWDVETWEQLLQVDLKGGFSQHAFLHYTKDGKFFTVPSVIGVMKVDAALMIPLNTKQPKIKGTPLMTHVASDYIVSKDKGHLHFLNLSTNESVQSVPLDTKMICSVEFNKFGYVGVGLKTGEVKVFDPETGKERFTMVSSGDHAIFKTPGNYYKATKEGVALVTFRVGHESFPFEQFDAKYNRPDILLAAMNSDKEDLKKLYYSAYNKRLKKLGLQEDNLQEGLDLPVVSINNTSQLPLVTADQQITLDVSATALQYELKKMNIWVNNVPVYGAGGMPIAGKDHNHTATFNLVSGINKIQVSCINTNGSESLRHTIDVECTAKVKPDLYVIAVGTSKYKNSDFDLNYAAKDATDVANLLKESKSAFNQIHVKTLTDERVSKDNFVGLRSFLDSGKVNDVVILFIAGHGLLDSELDYYYGTHDVDFNSPSFSGLKYEKIEALLDSILPLKKILIMDTCHSGEVEKDEVEKDESAPEKTDVVFRSAGPGIKQGEGVSPTRMMNELFNDLRRGTGATVIASAGGVEYAMEGSQWQNGLFTYCFLNALRNQKADINSDGIIMLSEVQEWVSLRVRELSGGAQSPTTRIQNIALDYQLW